jgi:hypothetical protein
MHLLFTRDVGQEIPSKEFVELAGFVPTDGLNFLASHKTHTSVALPVSN